MANIQSHSSAAKVGKVITYIVLLVFSCFAVVPLLWLFMNSFKTTQEFMIDKLSLPGQTEGYSATLVNYIDAWTRGKFPTLIMNSVIYTAGTVIMVEVLAIMAGFGFAKLRCKATKVLHGSFVIGILLTIQCIMVPLFLLVNAIGLYNSRLGVLIPYIGISLPMAVYLATEYIKSIPDALVESARIDGASYFGILARIIAPMAKPVAVTVAILTVSSIWNEFMLINILTSDDALKSLPVGINQFAGALTTDYGKQFASLVIGLIPMLAFYLVFRKEITKGVAAGAVKG